MTTPRNDEQDGAEGAAVAPPDVGAPRDVGRTSGGGNLGHVQPDRLTGQVPLRNNAESREDDETTMPSNDSTLNTKI